MMRVFIAVLFLTFISCKDEKKNYKYSFFNDVDKVEHITFEQNKISQKITLISDTLTKIVSLKIIRKENLKYVFDLLSKEYKNCTLMKCYDPKDVLYFYKENERIGFYEFCKECGGSRTSENLNNLPSFCKEKGIDLDEILKNN